MIKDIIWLLLKYRKIKRRREGKKEGKEGEKELGRERGSEKIFIKGYLVFLVIKECRLKVFVITIMILIIIISSSDKYMGK